MPHQCVRCGKMYDDGAGEILTGCECGSKLFYFIRQQVIDAKKNEDDSVLGADTKQRAQIEKDIYDIIGDEIDKNMPVVLDVESVRVTEQGRFELDLVHLFNSKQPLVYRLEEGKYQIDLANSFKKDALKDKKK